MVCSKVFWVNDFLGDNGITRRHNILTGSNIDYLLHWNLECRSNVKTHVEPSNSMKLRTNGCFGSTANLKCTRGFYFQRIHRSHIQFTMTTEMASQTQWLNFATHSWFGNRRWTQKMQ